MTKTTKCEAIRRGKIYLHNPKPGVTLEGEVSPCVFMSPGYPLQLKVTLNRNAGESQGPAYAVDRSLTAETATEADVSRLLSAIRCKPCSRCLAVTFDPTTVETHMTDLCDSCFFVELDVTLAEIADADKRRVVNRDRRMKAKGMKVRVSAWVHPANGGDYQSDWYFEDRPTAARIRNLLREAGSSNLDDFQIITI